MLIRLGYACISNVLNLSSSKTITLSWEWPFETKDTGGNIIGDTTDTNLGKDGTATVTVKATVTFTQVD